MLIEQKLEMNFEQAHVEEPLICQMARRFENLMFNVDALAVGPSDALMRITLVAEPPTLREVGEYFQSLGVECKELSQEKYRGELPAVPRRVAMVRSEQPAVEKKLWLTIVGSLRRNPFLWVLARRYDIDFKLMQSTTAEAVSIVSLQMRGAPAEVEGAVSYLREQGINVEYGQISVSAPFTSV